MVDRKVALHFLFVTGEENQTSYNLTTPLHNHYKLYLIYTAL